jgi:hypothetical protein
MEDNLLKVSVINSVHYWDTKTGILYSDKSKRFQIKMFSLSLEQYLDFRNELKFISNGKAKR